MSISSIRFSKDHNQDFYKVLQQRVSSYFKTENISRHGNINMFIKTIVMLAMYIVPFSMLFVLENSIDEIYYTMPLTYTKKIKNIMH